MGWPTSRDELIETQLALAEAAPPAWRPGRGTLLLGGCFICFARGPSGPGARGDRAWAAAALLRGTRMTARGVTPGEAGATYEPGLLALREGRLLETAVRALDELPDALLVNATGRDHPRRCGLALHLGAALELPTVGVTHRALLAAGAPPADEGGAASPLRLANDVVGHWLRTRPGTRPLAVHAAWRTDADTAVEIALAALGRARTPEPLRQARRLARTARSELA